MQKTYSRVVLHLGKEHSVLRRHPWIFSGAITSRDSELHSGDVVWVANSKGDILGTGFYSDGSIAVRLVEYHKTELDATFWHHKLQQAIAIRKQLQLMHEHTNVCRLFFGEGDGVPGLILDYYNGHVVMQLHHKGLYAYIEIINSTLQHIFGTALKSIYLKLESLHKHGQISNVPADGLIFGTDAAPVWVNENGHSFIVDRIAGQKTGFFIDQRDNRALVKIHSKARHVLNAFAYSGGFSVYAAAGQASSVTSVDISKPAIEACKLNMERNALQGGSYITADVFDVLREQAALHNLIILDPPAFAKHRSSKHQAVTAYKRLNTIAMKYAPKNSLLFTFSCSGVVDRNLFYNTIISAAMESNRNIQILQHLMQGADHPVLPQFPEGDYLKGLMVWIKD
jgi:23S rRNA (cytosine1962-C5)-methyltransferase